MLFDWIFTHIRTLRLLYRYSIHYVVVKDFQFMFAPSIHRYSGRSHQIRNDGKLYLISNVKYYIIYDDILWRKNYFSYTVDGMIIWIYKRLCTRYRKFIRQLIHKYENYVNLYSHENSFLIKFFYFFICLIASSGVYLFCICNCTICRYIV